MPVDILSVVDRSELFATLSGIDISVPGRVDGRTTDHAETWTIAHLLSTLGKADHLAFPLSCTHRDRPDSLVESGNVKIGIEITEAISQQYAAFSALAEREFPDALLEPAHFRWGAPNKSVEEMRGLLRQGQLSSSGWVGDRAEQEWALFLQSVIDTKLAKLARADFAKFDKNWLAIYDNLPMPHIDLAKAIAYLRPLLQDRWSRNPCFDGLFVEHGPVIAWITPTGSENLMLNDLWE
ncbi:MAG TPA: hypothetical protein VHA15_10180 [Burkholderiales bacterium]|nr:hypothetical protein [Burkholderiales bacterium]